MKLRELRQMLRQATPERAPASETSTPSTPPSTERVRTCERCDQPLRLVPLADGRKFKFCDACDIVCESCKRMVKWHERLGMPLTAERLCGSCTMVKK